MRTARGSTRSILVVDDEVTRRTQLIDRLAAAGLTPLAPKTPLDMFDMLSRRDDVVCLVAPSFGVGQVALTDALADNFPRVATTYISDDLDRTVARAVAKLAAT